MTWRASLCNDIDATDRMTGIFYRGYDHDYGDYLWYDSLTGPWVDADSGAQWIITPDEPGYLLRIKAKDENNGTLARFLDEQNWYEYNNTRYWRIDSSYFLWYNGSSSWYISTALGTCIAEEWDSDAGQYVGNQSWEKGDIELLGQYTVRGEVDGRTDIDVTWEIPQGYRRKDDDPYNTEENAPAGRYRYFERTATIDESGNIIENLLEPSGTDIIEYRWVGVPRFVDEEGTQYVRSANTVDGQYIYDEQYTYGIIHRNYEGTWILGVEDSSEGWYEGTEPDMYNDVTFTGQGILTGYEKVITFDEYIMGDETYTKYIGEVGLWI